MELDEDEDVIFEGSPLYEHLKSSHYSGPDIEFYKDGKHFLPAVAENSKPEPGLTGKINLQSIFSKFGVSRANHLEQFGQEIMQTLLKTSLISLEDTEFLANILDDKILPIPIQSNKCWFDIVPIGGVVLAMILLTSSRLPWRSRIPSLLFVGFNVLKTGSLKFIEWRGKKFSQSVDRFQIALNQIRELVSLMNKSTQFVQEMELIDRGFTLPNLMTHLSMKTLPNQSSALLCLPLREELFKSVEELCEIMRHLTLYVRRKVPLNSTIDHPSHYLACSLPVAPTQHVTLQSIRVSLRQCHQQTSEMLRRLALSFLVPVDCHHIELVDEMTLHLSTKILPLIGRLRAAFHYYTSWKVSDSPELQTVSSQDRPNGVDLALHSLERHLKAMALIIESVRGKDLLPEIQIQLNHECRNVATCWELVQIEMDKRSNPIVESIRPPSQAIHRPALDSADIQPLYGAWQPDVEDMEILEADLRLVEDEAITEGNDDVDLLALKRESREERLARQRDLAAQSKRLYCELQLVLKSKAAEWKEREAKVMQRLGLSHEPPTADGHQEDNDQEEDDTTTGTNQPDPAGPSVIRFDASVVVPSSTFGIQASLAAQVRAMASQRVQNEDLIGDSDDSDDSEDPDDAQSATSSTADV